MRDLLRLIRNYKQHCNQCSNDLKKEFVGPDAPEFWAYFASRFPLVDSLRYSSRIVNNFILAFHARI